MSSITFDTLKYVERLKSAGVPESQAKAGAEALVEVLSSSEVASKSDMVGIRQELIETKYDIIKWVIGLALAQMALIVGLMIKLL